MHLASLSLLNFRNHNEISLQFDKRIVCFTGANGSGKTNLLDAVYYLAFCKSYFNPADHQIINHTEALMVVQGTFDDNNEELKIYCGLKRGQRKIFKKNGREYDRLSDHIGLISAVMISPTDHFLISGGSEDRRRFLDSVISMQDRSYLENLIAYNRFLLQRNSLLRSFAERNYFDEASIEVWDMQLSQVADVIHLKRKEFITSFATVFSDIYSQIGATREIPTLNYESPLEQGSAQEILTQNMQRDRMAGTTTSGIHKDDIEFQLDGFPLKKFASQGQQKTFLLSLKIAQYYWLKAANGGNPILLLDDIFEKLDNTRVERLFNLVASDNFGQVFITDTDAKRIKKAFLQTNIEPQFIPIV